MSSKACSKCKAVKPLEDFYRYSKGADGRRACCKTCLAEQHGDTNRTRAKLWAKNNVERNRLRAKEWRDADETRKANSIRRVEDWARRNVERAIAVDRSHCRARTAKKLQAMPKWANAFFISEAYALARLRTRMTGFKWHVDHSVPLRSKVVCGLHVESNLRVIPASVNCSKANRFWPHMP